MTGGGYYDYSTGLVPGYTRVEPIPVKGHLQHEMEIMESFLFFLSFLFFPYFSITFVAETGVAANIPYSMLRTYDIIYARVCMSLCSVEVRMEGEVIYRFLIL